jgi:hypothetical protein
MDDQADGAGSGGDELWPRVRLLERWIERAITAEALGWFRQTLEGLAQNSPGALTRALALAPRRLGKADLPLAAADFRLAGEVRAGFDPTGLSADQAGRAAFLLASYRDAGSFAHTLKTLTRTADLAELVAFYRALALLPVSKDLTRRAAEGLRSGMKPVFEAMAHRNPYPREAFDQDAWNQMVLKALFIGSELNPIQGLDGRANPDLSIMLIDYAHERWAAHRPVSIELWRGLGRHVDDRGLTTLERLLASANQWEQVAAVLALKACDHPRARDLLTSASDLVLEIETGNITWHILQEGSSRSEGKSVVGR